MTNSVEDSLDVEPSYLRSLSDTFVSMLVYHDHPQL